MAKRNAFKVKPILLAGSALFSVSLYAGEGAKGVGLRSLTKDEDQKLSKTKIKKIHLNKLGLARINATREEHGLDPLPAGMVKVQDIETESGVGASGDTSGASLGYGGTLPAQVDNSTLAAFPKIGNQSSQNSCAAWASTYYLMSHETCLTLGCDNKNYSQKVFSPKWTYNMINNGADNGAYFSDAFSMINKHGAPTLAEFPYDLNYLAWDMNSSHWKSAVKAKMAALTTTPIATDTDMANVKQILTNGHVVVLGTYISSWQFKTVGSTTPYAGQAVAYFMNGTSGGHALTIVGYDDNIWTDINGNGGIDSGELGAFKIANSWGSSWKNGGYVWAAYDAFRATSAVPGFAPSVRYPLGYNSGNKVLMSTYSAYTPKLLAKVTVSHLKRSQMSLMFGSSSSTATTPSTYYTPFALYNKGGSLPFDGQGYVAEGTFYFDISGLYTSTSIDQQRFYLKAADNTSYDALTVTSFQVIDPTSDTIVMESGNLPVSIDASNSVLAATLVSPSPAPAADTIAPTIPTGVAGYLSSRKSGRRYYYTVKLSWNASTDNVGVAKYIVYRNGVKLGESTLAAFSDTTTQSGSTYNYQVNAVDAAGNQSALSAGFTLAR
jgi:C1A family cysteine protease